MTLCMAACLPDTDLLQAGKIGSTAIMQLDAHDLSVYSAAHTETEVSQCRLPAGMPWCLEPCCTLCTDSV